MTEAEKILENLISFRTDKQFGCNKACVDFICQILQNHQITFERLMLDDGKTENIIAGINVPALENIRGGVLLSGHMDTVGVNEGDWNSYPFKMVCKNGQIYGRGTADMKYFIAVILALLPQLKATGYPIFLTFSGDEETDVFGVRQIIDFMKEKNIHPRFALVGEPTHFDICTAHNGYCGFTTQVKGKSCHSSRPDLGSNAIYAAAKIIDLINHLNDFYQPLGTTLNVGVINGGNGRNSVADACSFDWDIRYVSESHRIQILQKIDDFCCELKKNDKNLNFAMTLAEELPALERKDNPSFLMLLQDITGGTDIRLPFATEAGFFQQYGIETLICGAPCTEVLHIADECISAADLKKYGEILIRLIDRLSL